MKTKKIRLPPISIENYDLLKRALLFYRDIGTMESQIFSVLKVRLCSGRKAFAKKGAIIYRKFVQNIMKILEI